MHWMNKEIIIYKYPVVVKLISSNLLLNYLLCIRPQRIGSLNAARRFRNCLTGRSSSRTSLSHCTAATALGHKRKNKNNNF